MSTARQTIRIERIGGRDGLRRLAVRFSQIMEARPDVARIRAMHKRDLAPIVGSLAEFLMGWIGGPRDWFMHKERPVL